MKMQGEKAGMIYCDAQCMEHACGNDRKHFKCIGEKTLDYMRKFMENKMPGTLTKGFNRIPVRDTVV